MTIIQASIVKVFPGMIVFWRCFYAGLCKQNLLLTQIHGVFMGTFIYLCGCSE